MFKRIDHEPVHKFLIDTLKKSGSVPIFDCPVKKVSVFFLYLLKVVEIANICGDDEYFTKVSSKLFEIFLQLVKKLVLICSFLFEFFQGHFYLQDFTIAGSDLPSIALAGEYKVEFAILQKIEESFVKVWRMVWYATIVNVWIYSSFACNESLSNESQQKNVFL